MILEYNKALRYLDIEKHDKAEDCLKKAIHIAKEENRNHELMEIYCCYGEVLAMMEREDEAKKYLNEVIAFYKKTEECEYEYKIARGLLDEIEEDCMS